MMPFPRTALAGLFAFASLTALGAGACSTDTPPETTDGGGGGGGEADGATSGKDGATGTDAGDAGVDAAKDAAPVDGSSEGGACPQGVTKPATGETCVGFGKKSPCNAACGEYGFVCFNGGPPAFTGCLQLSATAFGETYCCTQNKCVAQPDQDAMCAGVAGKPHRYQCPPDDTGTTNVAPPAGCVENGSGGTNLEKFYCCP
ncbi:MAG: hypothetical protein JST00_14645 [Deltaproteobacteria bacterium]|nr:hypothetical protein [Deltaproteobacteria bacterium]